MCPRLLGRKLAVATLVFATTALAQDADTGEEEAAEDDSAPVAEQEQSEDVETITVTGSRLQEGDPTAVVYSLTADEFAARGVSSVEELMRTLPWTYPSIT